MDTPVSKTLGKKQPAGQTGKVQSLTRALTLLELLAASEPGLSLTEIGRALELAPSTVHRLLNSMRQMGFVDCDDEQGIWSVGINAFIVGNAYLKKRDFVVQARPFMKRLVAETGETSNMAILEGDHIVFVSQIECSEVMRMVVQVGSRGPVHAAGVGKSLLSTLPEPYVRQMIERVGMLRLTDKTITTIDDLLKELALIRQRGYSMDDEEQSRGLRCIAANIYDQYGDAIAAVSISGPSVRVREDRVDDLAKTVMSVADDITRAIGGRKPSQIS